MMDAMIYCMHVPGPFVAALESLDCLKANPVMIKAESCVLVDSYICITPPRAQRMRVCGVWCVTDKKCVLCMDTERCWTCVT